LLHVLHVLYVPYVMLTRDAAGLYTAASLLYDEGASVRQPKSQAPGWANIFEKSGTL